jgi:hypothetical protein
MAQTATDDPLLPEREAISIDVRSAAFGTRVIDFKIQFVPPCFVRYYIPSPMVSTLSFHLQLQGTIRKTCSRMLWKS